MKRFSLLAITLCAVCGSAFGQQALFGGQMPLSPRSSRRSSPPISSCRSRICTRKSAAAASPSRARSPCTSAVSSPRAACPPSASSSAGATTRQCCTPTIKSRRKRKRTKSSIRPSASSSRASRRCEEAPHATASPSPQLIPLRLWKTMWRCLCITCRCFVDK